MTPLRRAGRDAALSTRSASAAISPEDAPPLRGIAPRLVLASASPRRAAILRSAGLEFETLPADVDESAVTGIAGPADRAIGVAALKAVAVARLRPGAVVLGADTVVVLDGRVLGKPSGTAEAIQMLRDLRGRDHQVITGVAVVRQGTVTSAREVTVVRLRALPDREVAEYVGTGSPLDKAGAYGIQDNPPSPAAGYDGCYLNVVGLPLCVAGRLLRQVGPLAGREAALPCPGHTPSASGPPGARLRGTSDAPSEAPQ